MPVPNVYINATENSLASYDFFDLSRRIGYKRCYLISTYQNSTQGVSLIPQVTDSSFVRYAVSNGTDLDFDLTFSSPQVLNGDVFISVVFENYYAGAVGMTLTYTLYHVTSGGTETSLGTDAGRTVTVSGGGYSKRDLIKFSLSNKIFKAGEKIRLNIVTATGSGNHYIYMDPANNTTTDYNDYEMASFKNDTNSFIDLPFKIDL